MQYLVCLKPKKNTSLCQRVAFPHWIFLQCYWWTAGQDWALMKTVQQFTERRQPVRDQARSITGRQAGERWKASYGKEQSGKSECGNGEYMLDWLHVTKGACVHRWAEYANEVGVAGRLSVAEAGSLEKTTELWSRHLQDLREHRLCLIVPLYDDAFCSPWLSQTLCWWLPGRPHLEHRLPLLLSVQWTRWLGFHMSFFFSFVVSLPFPTQMTTLQNSLFVIKERIRRGKPDGLRKACHLQ